MPDGSISLPATPATIPSLLESIEGAIYRGELDDAKTLLASARRLANGATPIEQVHVAIRSAVATAHVCWCALRSEIDGVDMDVAHVLEEQVINPLNAAVDLLDDLDSEEVES